jgi:hypothetical protein
MEIAYDRWREIRQNLSLTINEAGVIANHADWFNLKGPEEVKGHKIKWDGKEQDLFSIVYDPGDRIVASERWVWTRMIFRYKNRLTR